MNEDLDKTDLIEQLKDAVYEIKHDVIILKAKVPFWIKMKEFDKVNQAIGEINKKFESLNL